MKYCSKCGEKYEDTTLNFCLTDGQLLVLAKREDEIPTVVRNVHQTDDNRGNAGNTFNNQGWQNQQIFREPSNTLANQSTNLASNQDSTLAKVSFWFAILSIPFSLCYLFPGFIFAVIAVITGNLGKKKAEQNPENFGGVAKASSGMIIGSVVIGLQLLIGIYALIAFIVNNYFY